MVLIFVTKRHIGRDCKSVTTKLSTHKCHHVFVTPWKREEEGIELIVTLSFQSPGCHCRGEDSSGAFMGPSTFIDFSGPLLPLLCPEPIVHLLSTSVDQSIINGCFYLLTSKCCCEILNM